MEFSEPQEYKGEIPFLDSKNVTVCFHLSKDGAKITQIDINLGELTVMPKDEDTIYDTITFNDAGVTVTDVDVIDGKIYSDYFLTYELTVIDSCIYGMVGFMVEQHGIMFVSPSVYTVIPNITTPHEIPANIRQP